MRRKATTTVAVVASCALLLGYSARVVTVHTFHDDACLVISQLVAAKIEKGEPVSDVELMTEIAGLIRASVIHGRVDSSGSPADLNGNAFLIRHTGQRVIVSTRLSFLQPIRSHAETDIKSPNERAQMDSRLLACLLVLPWWPGRFAVVLKVASGTTQSAAKSNSLRSSLIRALLLACELRRIHF